MSAGITTILRFVVSAARWVGSSIGISRSWLRGIPKASSAASGASTARKATTSYIEAARAEVDAITDAMTRNEEKALSGAPGTIWKWRPPGHEIADAYLKWVKMNTDPKMSSRPCGCDPGANHVAEGCVGRCLSLKEDVLEDHGRETGPFITNPNAKSAYVTKDSGERQEFASGMKRDTTTGKFLYHLVRFGPMFLRWVALLTRGAVKYDANNWMKANGKEEHNRFCESADRHFAIWLTYRLTGVNIEDPENPVPDKPLTEDHAAAVFFNINGAEYVAENLPVPVDKNAAMDATVDRENARIDAEIRAIKQKFEAEQLERKRQAEQQSDVLGRPGLPCCGLPEHCSASGCVIRQQHEAAKRFNEASANPAFKRIGRFSTTELRNAGIEVPGPESSWTLTAERERY